ncbi:hypothetical protein K3495_g2763 [Podosphaera aphanis]|nr:hypothetical protein K3495_g2763 [Podosphaera aphanis]
MAAENISPTETTKQDLLALSFEQLTITTTSSKAPPGPPCLPWEKNHLSPANGIPKKAFTPRKSLQSTSSAKSLPTTPILLRKASTSSLHSTASSHPALTRRKSSTHFTNASTLVGKHTSENNTPRSPRLTSASIASSHFKAELELHTEKGDAFETETIVILHDLCYGHRFSRPRTSKATLDMIVERPERIHASILGLSMAYVRLGERYSGGKHPPLPKDSVKNLTVPFRIRRSTRRISLSSPVVTNVHGSKWMEELKLMCDSADSKLAVDGKELVRPKMKRGTSQDAPEKFHEGDLYLCSESLNAIEGALGAVCDGVDAVFQGATKSKGPKRSFITIRPPGHHCSASHPSGFCWVNNIHVGISYAASTYGLTHAAILDFDLHHGDGSQSIAWESNQRALHAAKNSLSWKKKSIGYFSLHDINSYPCEMGDEEKVKNASLCIDNAHGQSIWNVHLQPWKNEAEFWALYETKYSILIEKARNYLHAQTARLRFSGSGPPKAAIFLSAGFDASEWEGSGMQRHKVNVPTEFYARFTRDVIQLAQEYGTSVDGRVISVLEGGYSDRALYSGILSHLSGMAAENPTRITKQAEVNDIPQDKAQDDKNAISHEKSTARGKPEVYDPTWWSRPCLEELDLLRNSHPVAPEPLRPRDVTSTFSSPTQSFISKVTAQAGRHTMSVMSNLGNRSPRPVTTRAPSPPPPEVTWAVATYELSKLLIPTERQTTSCKAEELSVETVRRRAQRETKDHPSTGAQNPDSKPGGEITVRMALRSRKPPRGVESAASNHLKKNVSKGNGS